MLYVLHSLFHHAMVNKCLVAEQLDAHLPLFLLNDTTIEITVTIGHRLEVKLLRKITISP